MTDMNPDKVWAHAQTRMREAWYQISGGKAIRTAIECLYEFPEMLDVIDRRVHELKWVRWELLVVFLCTRTPGSETLSGVAKAALETAYKGGWLEITDHQHVEDGPVNIYARFVSNEAMLETFETVSFYDADERLRGDDAKFLLNVSGAKKHKHKRLKR